MLRAEAVSARVVLMDRLVPAGIGVPGDEARTAAGAEIRVVLEPLSDERLIPGGHVTAREAMQRGMEHLL